MKISRMVLDEKGQPLWIDTGLQLVRFEFEDGGRITARQERDTGRLVLNGVHDLGIGTLSIIPRGSNHIEVEVVR